MTRLTLIAAAAAAALLPLAAQAYEMPLRGADLAENERYSTKVHTGGIQAEGKDIGARRRTASGSWSGTTTDGADTKVVTNWLIYGKPIYAMASGVVIGCWRNAPNNIPGSYDPAYTAGKIPGGGNHLWIRQDDGVVALYAHTQPGSIPAALCPHNAVLLSSSDIQNGNPDIRKDAVVTNGARVTVGQMIGRVGNSGASGGGPHLHVHMEKDGRPVVMTFDRGMTTPAIEKASLDGPWTRLKGKALPNEPILIWPPRVKGDYTFNGIKAADHQRLVEHMNDSGMAPNLITCANNGATYNATWSPAKGEWGAHHGMSAKEAEAKNAAYLAQGYKRTSTFTCGTVSVAVWKK